MKTLLVTLLLLLGLKAHATDFSQYEKHQYANADIVQNQSLPYRMLMPDNFDAKKKYPLILMLHGAGERGDDNIAQLTHGAEMFLTEQFRSTYPAIIVFPQAAKDDYWVNVDVKRDTRPIEFTFKVDAAKTPSMQLLLGLVEELSNTPYIDSDKMAVMGLSMGAMGTYDIISTLPGTFKAAVPICGGGHPDLVNTMDLSAPVWAFHGELDDVVAVAESKKMVNAINAAGGNAKLTIYPDVKHNSWDNAFAEANLLPWVFSHLKN
ncbi:prolyl oligopeptidase family serine peptidase [Glaciecola siphonariae]|uniref:Prolyl oligopeptidase family serine peptidase n=1 Tax=Glaciecola siphonariae TaxID=521012 RepID=A0ABV9LYI0_9ALTE